VHPNSFLTISLRLLYVPRDTLVFVTTRGVLTIDPPAIFVASQTNILEIVIPYTEWSLGHTLMEQAAALTRQLGAVIRLIAVHTIPYPVPFVCPAGAHAHLVGQLIDLAAHCPIPVRPEVVLARSREEGFRYALKTRSTVLVASHRRPWKTSEEKLADSLALAGHNVALLHMD
jgi:hypothetical protein